MSTRIPGGRTLYTITDMTTSRTLGEVTASSVRGARITAARRFNTRFEWVMAYPQTDAFVNAMIDLPSGDVAWLEGGI
jgi:hypothetical protein